ncbi:MAG TPA: ABC transporter permease [Vicinamibacterales bacterium]|nr:ABC transporter permease [Vicinamibacterales bacterium]HOQ60589.1 ABC transporter permease [Vicinamibacterales bacterium]HPK70898.1 ABC transporter permease [Vicinamibacterales bacterium]
MLKNLRGLLKYRQLIQSMVARELKARYRGSVLGFFWSFINPLLLLLVYTFVFSYVLPARQPNLDPYALFLFCGILPWTWFSSSILESANVLISGGNLLKKVMFPAEVLPFVTVLANMVHFFLGLPILVGFLIYYRAPLQASELAWFPVVVLVQLVLTLGLALIVSALTVHFRDLKDILSNLVTFWFFATPIIYSMQDAPALAKRFLNGNPFTHLAISYQEILFYQGDFGHWKWLLALGAGSVALFLAGYYLFDRLRDTFAEEV